MKMIHSLPRGQTSQSGSYSGKGICPVWCQAGHLGGQLVGSSLKAIALRDQMILFMKGFKGDNQHCELDSETNWQWQPMQLF